MTGLNESIQTYSTAAAALFAAVSAGIAVWAMNRNMESSRSLLAETQRTNARQGFEQRYTLLLTQHNALHDSLCKHLDTEPKICNDYGVKYALSQYNSLQSGLERYFYFLTGHPVISPYMRVLFHLLKHINDDPYVIDKSDEEKRVYSSPLRSYIRNDVLFLIAVNALNIKSERLKEAGYPKYQKLLHRFNFFEHAVFTNPRQANEPFIKLLEVMNPSVDKNNHADVVREYFILELKDACGYIMGCFIKAIKQGRLPQEQDMKFNVPVDGNIKIMLPHDLISTPLLACTAVYSNPHLDGYNKARVAYANEIYARCESEYKATKERSEQAQAVLKYINGTYTDLDGVQHTISTIEDLTSFASSVSPIDRVKVVIQASGTTSDESVTLFDIRDELQSFIECGSITWPQDELHFYSLLKKRIQEVMEEANRTLVNSLRCQFD